MKKEIESINIKKREIKLPNKYINNINTNNIKTNNNANNTNNNISSRANLYKRPLAGGKTSMTAFLIGKGKK